MTDHERLLSDHLENTAANTRLTFTIDDVVNKAEQSNTGSHSKGRILFAAAACAAVLVGFVLVTEVNRGDSDAVATGSTAGPFDPVDEVVIRSVEPNPSNDSYVWAAAFGIDGLDRLDSVNIGRMTPAELAARGVVGNDDLVCRGTIRMLSIGCDAEPGPKPVRFSGSLLDIGAWVWTGIQDETAIVQFTAQNGDVKWQRPLDGTALFADNVDNDDGRHCGCTFLAIDHNGTIIERYQLD